MNIVGMGRGSRSDYHVDFLCSYNVGCTKRVGLFPNRKTTLENAKKQRALNGSLKPCSLESKKKVSFWLSKHVVLSQPQLGNSWDVDPKTPSLSDFYSYIRSYTSRQLCVSRPLTDCTLCAEACCCCSVQRSLCAPCAGRVQPVFRPVRL